MFVAQIMYAEGLKKILNAILSVQNYQTPIEEQLSELRERERLLRTVPGCIYAFAVSTELKQKRESYARRNKGCSEAHAANLQLLEKCGIRPSEYKAKFALISEDCLRIGHGSVTPPSWQPA